MVITAQGIARKEKALGYAVTTITSEDIERKPETDISKILTGKIPGVQINTGGGFLGTNTNVIIRSKNSISGSNQPLYVVDGAPITEIVLLTLTQITLQLQPFLKDWLSTLRTRWP